MAKTCCDNSDLAPFLKKARWVLWFALIVNFSMFIVEIAASFSSGSESLKADALDFLADSISYIVTLFVLQKYEKLRDLSASIKGWLMTLMGLWVLISAIYKIWTVSVPEAQIMGAVGLVALMANVAMAKSCGCGGHFGVKYISRHSSHNRC